MSGGALRARVLEDLEPIGVVIDAYVRALRAVKAIGEGETRLAQVILTDRDHDLGELLEHREAA